MEISHYKNFISPLLNLRQFFTDPTVPVADRLSKLQEVRGPLGLCLDASQSHSFRFIHHQHVRLESLVKAVQCADRKPLTFYKDRVQRATVKALRLVDLLPDLNETNEDYIARFEGLMKGLISPLWEADRDLQNHPDPTTCNTYRENSTFIFHEKTPEGKKRTFRYWQPTRYYPQNTALSNWFSYLDLAGTHQGALLVYDFSLRHQSNAYPMLVMETLDYTLHMAPLAPYVSSPSDLYKKILEIMETMAAMSQVYVHGDIKPQNVGFRTVNQQPVIFDQESSIRLEELDKLHPVLHQRGTEEYFPPEALKPPPSLDFRPEWRLSPQGDVYSLGMTLLQSLSKEPPGSLLASSLLLFPWNLQPAPFDKIPPPLVQWLQRSLSPNPQNRFRNMAHMLEEFRKIS